VCVCVCDESCRLSAASQGGIPPTLSLCAVLCELLPLRSANFVKFRASGEATGLTTKPPNFSQVVFLTYFRCTHHLDTVIRDEGGARQGLRSVTPAGLALS